MILRIESDHDLLSVHTGNQRLSEAESSAIDILELHSRGNLSAGRVDGLACRTSAAGNQQVCDSTPGPVPFGRYDLFAAKPPPIVFAKCLRIAIERGRDCLGDAECEVGGVNPPRTFENTVTNCGMRVINGHAPSTHRVHEFLGEVIRLRSIFQAEIHTIHRQGAHLTLKVPIAVKRPLIIWR